MKIRSLLSGQMPCEIFTKDFSERYGPIIVSVGLFLVWVGDKCIAFLQKENLTDPATWDLLLLSGIVTFTFAVRLARTIPSKLEDFLTRMANRGTLHISETDLQDLKTNINRRASLWAHYSGLVTTVALSLAFTKYLSKGIQRFLDAQPHSVWLIILSTIGVALIFLFEVYGAYIAGRYLGQPLFYGRLCSILKQQSAPLQVIPGHLDGAAGLKPLGDFYFFQAMVVAIPPIFLAAWWFLFRIPSFENYKASWGRGYFGLFIFTLLFEIMAFFIPLWLFHIDMEKQKKRFLKDADHLSQRIMAVQAQLEEEQDADKRQILEEQLSYCTNHYWNIERMPTWPVAPKVVKQFSLYNLIILLSPWLGDRGQALVNTIQQLKG